MYTETLRRRDKIRRFTKIFRVRTRTIKTPKIRRHNGTRTFTSILRYRDSAIKDVLDVQVKNPSPTYSSPIDLHYKTKETTMTTDVESILVDPNTKCLDKMLSILPFIDPDSSRFIEWIWISRMKNAVKVTEFSYYDMPYTKERRMQDMIDLITPHVDFVYKGETLMRGVKIDPTNSYLDLYVVLEFSGNFALSVFGDNALVKNLVEIFKTKYTEPKTVTLEMLSGFTNQGPKILTRELKEENQAFAHDDFYPNITQGIDQYLADYANNKSNVLLLIGPPGTGKSTFLRTLFFRMGRSHNGLVTNETALGNPNFMDWVEQFSEDAVIGIEDADNLVKKRADGNFQMSALLSHAEGVVANDTKMIISTNLATTKDVDEALLRPGRAYHILKFGLLTVEQANKARAAVNLQPLPDDTDREFTLAEALNYENVQSLESHVTPPMGFIKSAR